MLRDPSRNHLAHNNIGAPSGQIETLVALIVVHATTIRDGLYPWLVHWKPEEGVAALRCYAGAGEDNNTGRLIYFDDPEA